MNKYKILIFDLDDTLIDNLENVKYAFKGMIESKNEKLDDEYKPTMTINNLKELIQIL